MTAGQTSTETGERLARIETHLEHVKGEQASLSRDYAAGKAAVTESIADIKESMIQLRISSETQLRTLEAAHKRIDSVDAELRQIDAKVEALSGEVHDFKTKAKVYVSIGTTLITMFWAVFGHAVQDYTGKLLGGP